MNDALDWPDKNYNNETLRTVLAINRGMEFVENVYKNDAGKPTGDQNVRMNRLGALYRDIHRQLYQDWGRKASETHDAGEVLDAGKREAIRAVMAKLTNAFEPTPDAPAYEDPLFNGNGYVRKHESQQLAKTLAQFYQELRSIEPYSYGNKLTADSFMASLGKLPNFAGVYRGGIDFTRIGDEDRAALDAANDTGALAQAFIHAMDTTRTPEVKNCGEGELKHWHDGRIKIGELTFLSHKKPNGTVCLVTMNGGLIPLKDIGEPLLTEIRSGRQIADYKLDTSTHDFLPGTEALHNENVTHIDGFPVGKNGAAPLFCLDTNIMTGLRKENHEALERLLEEVAGRGTPITALNNNTKLEEELLTRADGNETLRRSVEVACKHINVMVSKIDALTLVPDHDGKKMGKMFQGKEVVDNPKLYVSMGGGGSGKSFVKDFVQADWHENWVKASLDDARDYSDAYTVLKAANHHSDDYEFIKPYAEAMRAWTEANARKHGYNELFDGTGIDYRGRYDRIMSAYKQRGYRTEIIAVDVPLSTAVQRIQDRFKKDGRALIWSVTLDKHLRAPQSFMDAARDSNVDKISLFANDGDEGCQRLIAESHVLDAKQLMELQERKAGLPHLLGNLAHTQSDALCVRKPDVRLPDLTNDNTSFIAYPLSGGESPTYKVLAIYDMQRFVQFLEKGRLNPHTDTIEQMAAPSQNLPFYTGNWTEKLRSASEAAADAGRARL